MLPDNHPLLPAQEFLRTLFEHAPADHLIEFRAIKSKRHKKAKAPATLIECCEVGLLEKSFDRVLADWIVKIDREGYDVYYGVCPRESMRRTDSGQPRAGKAENVSVACAAWVDLDNLNWRDVLAAAEQDGAPDPTIVVASGHGAHLYFRYKEPVDAARGSADSKRLAERFGGDDTSDTPRILRLPGTHNWKDEEPFEVELVKVATDNVFSGLAPISGDFSKIPWDVRSIILGGHDKARPPYASEEGKLDRSNIDYRVMIKLFEIGIEEDEVIDIFTNPEHGISAKVLDEADRNNAENYLTISIRKAQAKAEVRMMESQQIGEILLFETTAQLATAPPLKFAVDRVMPVGGMCFVTGPAKAGKSLIVNDLMLLLAGAEGDFLDRYKINLPGTVVYCQAELSRGSLKFRNNRIASSRGSRWEDLPIHFYNGRFNFGEERHVNALRQGLKKVKAQYLIIDPLARFHRKNENRTDDMSLVLSNIERAAREAQLLGTVVVHHHGKPVGDGAVRQGAHRARGSSVIADWGNSHVIVDKGFADATDKKYVRVSFELRDADEPPPMTLTLDKESLRFKDFSEEQEKIDIVLGKLGEDEPKDRADIVEEVREELGTSKVNAERMVRKAEAQKKFGKKDDNGHTQTG